jgi:hypothetical protein
VHRHNGRSPSSNCYYLNCDRERVENATDVSAGSAPQHNSTAGPSYANCASKVVASSHQHGSTTGKAVVALSDPNHHIEELKEASHERSKEAFSLFRHTEELEELIQFAEAKQLLGKLSQVAFGDPLHESEWPREMEESLKQALPIKRKYWELIDWFYRLPADHRIFIVTHRRQTLRAVVQNLRVEPQKIRSARQAIKLHGNLDPSESDTLRTGWTVQLRLATHDEFPDLILPERYEMVPPDIQERIVKRIAMNEAGWTPDRIVACKTQFPHVPESEFILPFERLPLHVQEQIKYRIQENERQQP